MSDRTCTPPRSPNERPRIDGDENERRIWAHFAQRFFEAYGLFYELDGRGFYWVRDEARPSFPKPNKLFNGLALGLLQDKGETLSDTCARIDVVFACSELRRLGITLAMANSYFDVAVCLELLEAHVDGLDRSVRGERAA